MIVAYNVLQYNMGAHRPLIVLVAATAVDEQIIIFYIPLVCAMTSEIWPERRENSGL